MKSAGSLQRAIRGLDLPEAIVRLMAEGLSQEEATDFAMDYQRWKPKPKGKQGEQPKFTDSEFFREVLKKHNGDDRA